MDTEGKPIQHKQQQQIQTRSVERSLYYVYEIELVLRIALLHGWLLSASQLGRVDDEIPYSPVVLVSVVCMRGKGQSYNSVGPMHHTKASRGLLIAKSPPRPTSHRFFRVICSSYLLLLFAPVSLSLYLIPTPPSHAHMHSHHPLSTNRIRAQPLNHVCRRHHPPTQGKIHIPPHTTACMTPPPCCMDHSRPARVACMPNAQH